MIIKRNRKRCYERMSRPNRRNIHEDWQSGRDGEFFMRYDEDFSEPAMVGFDHYPDDEEWDEYLDKNSDWLLHQYEVLQVHFNRSLVNHFQAALYDIERKYDLDDALDVDDILYYKFPYPEEIYWISSSYEDKPYYKDLCDALQKAGELAEKELFEEFKDWR